MGTIVTSLPPWALFLLVMLYGILAVKAGSWAKRLKERKYKDDKPASVSALLGALLGLLAFMLAFTFSITAARFSERKHLVVDQGKAIGTCYLRTDLLPDSQKLATKRLFNEYMDLLIGTTKTAISIEENVTKLEALQIRIWVLAASLKNENMDPQLRSLYIASVNEVLDIFGERKTVVLIFKIPSPIWEVLLLLFGFSLFTVGLENSSFKLVRNLNILIMTAAFGLIVTLISAMDASTRPGHFTVNQQPLIDVQQMIKEDLQRR